MISSPAAASLSVLVVFDRFTTWIATLSCCRYWLLTQLSILLYRMCQTNVHLRLKWDTIRVYQNTLRKRVKHLWTAVHLLTHSISHCQAHS